MWSSTGPIRYAASITWAHCEPARRWRGAWEIPAPRRSITGCLTQGSRWIDANLFNGEYYVQQVRGFRNDQIAPHLRGDMGANQTEHPEYQVGDGCLVDQLMGQYLAHVAGLGDLVSRENMVATLHAIYGSNYKRTLLEHDNVERTFALNDEAAVVICELCRRQAAAHSFSLLRRSLHRAWNMQRQQ